MKIKVRGEWIDAEREPVVISLSAGELDQVNGIPRGDGDNRPRIYAQFPNEWGTADEMRSYMEVE